VALLIAFSGIDGSGKTTLARRLVDWLRETGRAAELVRTISGDSDFFRALAVLIERHPRIDKNAAALLFVFERAKNALATVAPLLERGVTVVCDRYFLCEQAYAAGHRVRFGGGIGRELMALAPPADLTFVVDVPVAVAMERIARRGRTWTFQENAATLTRARRAFLRLARGRASGDHGGNAGGDVVVIDGTAPLQAAWEAVRQAAERRLALGGGRT